MYDIAFLEQETRKVSAVLPGRADDKTHFARRVSYHRTLRAIPFVQTLGISFP
jgi:hypothetical protein